MQTRDPNATRQAPGFGAPSVEREGSHGPQSGDQRIPHLRGTRLALEQQRRRHLIPWLHETSPYLAHAQVRYLSVLRTALLRLAVSTWLYRRNGPAQKRIEHKQCQRRAHTGTLRP